MCFFLPQHLTRQEKRPVGQWHCDRETGVLTPEPHHLSALCCVVVAHVWSLAIWAQRVYCIPEPKPLASNSRGFFPVCDKFRVLSSPQSSYSFLDCARIINVSKQVPSSDTPQFLSVVTLPWIGNYFCGNVHVTPSTTSLRRELCPVLIAIVSSVTKPITLSKQMRNL